MTTTNNTQGNKTREEPNCNETAQTTIDKFAVNLIDPETAQAVKKFTEDHKDFLNRTITFGSPLQKAKANLFLKIAQGVRT